jgi:gamma-tubulin complex component 3
MDFEILRKWVHTASIETNKRLIEIMLKKYKFLDHCNAIRKYLLLGQGDFI